MHSHDNIANFKKLHNFIYIYIYMGLTSSLLRQQIFGACILTYVNTSRAKLRNKYSTHF